VAILHNSAVAQDSHRSKGQEMLAVGQGLEAKRC